MSYEMSREPMPAPDWLNAAVREWAMREAERENDVAYEAALCSLRPRLRWAADHVKVLRLLKRLGLWTPPTLKYDTRGGLIGVERK